MTSNYWASTQCNEWLLSRPQVALARAEDLEYAQSADELFALRIWLTNCISTLTKKLSLRQRITATAIIFFHRFYACSPGNSFSSTDPALVATACVYVAAKVEETPTHIRNVSQEAARMWNELGYWNFPVEIAALAEMEFYLLEDLHFHLVVYHPYRSLITIATAVGKGAVQHFSSKAAASVQAWQKTLDTESLSSKNQAAADATPLSDVLMGSAALPAYMDSDLAFGSPGDGLSGKAEDMSRAAARSPEKSDTKEQEQRKAFEDALEEQHRALLSDGDDHMPLAYIEELDEQVLQMAWFILNDSYRTDLPLLFPPHLVAVAAIFLALVLHDPSRLKMLKSQKWMVERREIYQKAVTEGASISTSAQKEGGSPKRGDVDSPAAASPPKQQSASSSNGATLPKAPLRGLSSLPPRPSHLPMRPGSVSQTAHTSQSPAPTTPVGTPKPQEITASQVADSSTSSNGDSTMPPVPPPDAMTFLAALNVDLNIIGEIVQELITLYQFWSQEVQEDGQKGKGSAINFNDGPSMLKRLEKMREVRRLDLMQNGPGW